MDFTLTDEQQMLRETAASLFDAEFPSGLLREACYDPTPGGPAALARSFDTHLRDWFALGDESAVDQCLFLEEAGAAVVAGPLWSSSALALPLLRAVGGEGACAETADAIAAGSVTATVALAGRSGEWVTNSEPTKRLVPDAGWVDRIVVVNETDGASGPLEVSVVGAQSVECRPVASLDRSRPLFDVTAPVSRESERLDREALADSLERATVTLAAELVGVARWLRTETIAHVCEREQFGRPVGSFQGLQWKLVDAALLHERACRRGRVRRDVPRRR